MRITAFAGLDDAVRVQGFDLADVTLADIVLPDTLEATGEDGAPLTVEGVTWACTDPDTGFDAEADGLYTFTAALPDGYTLAAGVALPEITVIVRVETGVVPTALGDYHAGDVAVIADIINAHGLSYDPSDPDSWPTSGVSGLVVTWSGDTTNKRVERLRLGDLNLTGTLNVAGLDALEYLYCSYNSLTELDMTGLAALQELYCSNNSLTKLDVTGLDALQELYCNKNSLTGLDVTGLAALEYLWCDNNSLTKLDVAGLNALQRLDCDINSLTELDLSGLDKLHTLYCYNNSLTKLDLSGLDKLQTLECRNNRLTELDLSGLDALQALDCQNNSLTELDLSGLDALEYLHCQNNSLTELDLSHNPPLWYFRGGGQTVELELEGNDTDGHTLEIPLNSPTFDGSTAFSYNAGTHTLKSTDKTAGSTSFTVETGHDDPLYKLGGTMEFTYREKAGEPKYHAGDVAVIAAIINAHGLNYDPSDPDSWPTSIRSKFFVKWSSAASNKRVEQLGLRGLDLTGTLDVTGLDALERLYCYNNSLTELDLTGLDTLQTLYCNNNSLTELNLSGLAALQSLYCQNNSLTELDLSHNPPLWNFEGGNQTVELELEGNAADGYMLEIPLNSPTFDGSTIFSYDAGNHTLKSTDNTVLSTSFTVDTSHTNQTRELSGTMKFTYKEKANEPIYHAGDVEVIAAIINAHGLNYDPGDPDSWPTIGSIGFVVTWSSAATNKRVERLRLEDLNLTGTLDVSGLAALEYLNCSINSLTELDLSGLDELQNLNCYSNSLTKLDLSGLDKLRTLDCYNNSLTELNLSGLAAVRELFCQNNNLTELDVTGLAALLWLNCENNNLTGLDLSHNPLLWYFQGGNQTVELELEGNAADGYMLEIPLNSPTFDDSTIFSYDAGNHTLKSMDKGADSTSFTVETGHSNSSYQLSGRMEFTYKTVYTITASAGANGTISPSGDVTVADGGNQPFAITPDNGYEIGDVVVDGRSVGAVSSYDFTNISGNHTIHATFKQKPTINAQTPDIQTHPQSQTVAQGEGVTLSVSASVTDGGTLSYQWYIADDDTGMNARTMQNEQGASFSPPTDAPGTYYYFVRVTNTNNSVNGTKTTTLDSDVATVTVTQAPGAPIVADITAPAPVFVGQTLALTTPSVDPNGDAVTAEGWQTSEDGQQWADIDTTTPLTATHDGQHLRYAATNGKGMGHSNTVTLTVITPTLTADATAAATATVGRAFTYTVGYTYVGPGTPSFALTGDVLPGGLNFDAATGAITGTPDANTEGEYSFTITINGNGGALTASTALTLTVQAAPEPAVLTIAGPSDDTATVGAPYTKRLAVTYTGEDALVYTATGLPAGVEINRESGVVSGTPTAAGSFNVTITVAEANGELTSTTGYKLTVNAAVTELPPHHLFRPARKQHRAGGRQIHPHPQRGRANRQHRLEMG